MNDTKNSAEMLQAMYPQPYVPPTADDIKGGEELMEVASLSRCVGRWHTFDHGSKAKCLCGKMDVPCF